MFTEYATYRELQTITEQTARDLSAERARADRAEDIALGAWYRVEWLEQLSDIIPLENERFTAVMLRAYDEYESADNNAQTARAKADETDNALYHLRAVCAIWETLESI